MSIVQQNKRQVGTSWAGPVPTHCQHCHLPIEEGFVQGNMISGEKDIILCLPCYTWKGIGLGEGYGHLFLLDKESGVFKRER
jgi:hypothetical protein